MFIETSKRLNRMKSFELASRSTETFSHTVSFNVYPDSNLCFVKHFVYDRYAIMSFLNGKQERLTVQQGRKRWVEFRQQGMKRIK